MTRLRRLLALLLTCTTCTPPNDPTQAAATFAVEDLIPRRPTYLTPYLSPRWQIPKTNDTQPIPDEALRSLQEASGLPVLPDSLRTARDSTVAVLYMFRPLVVSPDSVRVLAGWMGLVGGDGGRAWGHEYSYVLDCSDGCRLLADPRFSIWN